jgi:hypothetical protein
VARIAPRVALAAAMGVAAGLVALCSIIAASEPAGARLQGPCTGSGTLRQTGRTYDAKTVDFVKIPRTGDVDYVGTTEASGKRVAVGQVRISLPPPIGKVVLGQWGKDGKQTGSSGRRGKYHYDVTNLIAGIKFPVSGYDDEPGLPRCSGAVVVQIDGHSPLAWVSLGLSVVAIAGVALSIRPRGVTA